MKRAENSAALALRPGEGSLAVYGAALLVTATAVALGTKTYEFLFYILIMVVVIAVVAIVHRRVNLSIATLWCLAVWGTAHMAGGMVPIRGVGVLYSLWLIQPYILKYDQVVHAYGFGVTAWVCWQAIRAKKPDLLPTLGMVTLAALAAMGLGALNEVVEFTATKLVPTNVGDYENNAWDLVFNMTGAVIAAGLIWTNGRRKTATTA